MAKNELINKHKILEMAVENANQGEMFVQNANKALAGLSIEEQIMMLGFTYVRLLSNITPMSKETVRQLLCAVNTTVQNIAQENQQYREYTKRQIEMIPITENASVEMMHQLNAKDFETALETACKLLDIYSFGIAGSYIYQNALEKAKSTQSLDCAS